MTQQGGDKKLHITIRIPRCTFVGGDENGDFTGEQIRFPCKLRRHICARCGMHRGEHNRATTAIREELLPPRKRAAFRRLGQSSCQLPASGGAGAGEKEKRSVMEEGEIWTGDAIIKGKRGPRRKRADALSAEKFE